MRKRPLFRLQYIGGGGTRQSTYKNKFLYWKALGRLFWSTTPKLIYLSPFLILFTMTDKQRLARLRTSYDAKSKAYFSFLQVRAKEPLTDADRIAATELYQPVWAIYKTILLIESRIK